ncbi:MAG: FlgD immunoglobulin-like domain containing protein, partial [Candidatus Latescibacterota bacterium]|nr:FlgD immunoglobulin-like domain containing protein [Candidatus Latescibacterota bacterium]
RPARDHQRRSKDKSNAALLAAGSESAQPLQRLEPDPSSLCPNVRASVVNLLGLQIRHLRDDRLAAGDHLLHWDGTDDRGHDLATGMYAVRVRVNGQERRCRVMLLR